MSLLVSPPAVSGGSQMLERFHLAVKVWFELRFGDGPKEAQAQGWPATVACQHTTGR
jgi:hypothetical protein